MNQDYDTPCLYCGIDVQPTPVKWEYEDDLQVVTYVCMECDGDFTVARPTTTHDI